MHVDVVITDETDMIEFYTTFTAKCLFARSSKRTEEPSSGQVPISINYNLLGLGEILLTSF